MRTPRIWFPVVAIVASCHRGPASSKDPRVIFADAQVAGTSSLEDGGPPAAAPSTTGTSPLGSVDRSWITGFKGSKVLDEKHAMGVLAVAFLPDGVHAMSSGIDDTARLWDLRTAVVTNRLTGPRFKFHRVVFTRDGQRAFSASEKPTYWDVATGNVLLELQGAEIGTIDALALSHDDGRAVSVSPGMLTIWELSRGTILRQLHLRGQAVSVRFSDDDRHVRVVTDLSTCSAEVQGSGDLGCVELPLLEIGRIVSGSAGESETLLGTRVGELFVWDNGASRIKKHWAAEPRTQEIVDVHLRDRLHRAVSAGESRVRLWDVQKGAAIAQLGTSQPTVAVAMSDDGRLALIGSEGGIVQLWKLPVP